MKEYAAWLKTRDSDTSECDTCEKVHKDHGTLPDCVNCNKPILLPENFDLIQVHSLCRNQLIVAPMGGVIGVDLQAIVTVADLLGIDDKIFLIERMNVFVTEHFRKEEPTGE